MKRSVIVISIIAVVGIALYFIFGKSKKTEIAYTEVNPKRTELRVVVASTGVVAPEERIELKAPVPGRMENVLVKEGHRVKRGQIIAWMSSTERAAILDSARAVSSDEYKKFQEYYKATPIVAPVSGQIILRNSDPGQTVASTDVLLVVSNKLQVIAKVDETDIARVKPGLAAEIILDAYPQEAIAAQVSTLAFESKTVNNVTTYDVDTVPLKEPSFMRSGMTANVTFILRHKEDVLALPLSAIQFKKESPYVLSRDAKGKVIEVPIEIGEADGSNTEILSGLDEHSVVLIPNVQMNAKQGTNPFMFNRRKNQSGSKSAH